MKLKIAIIQFDIVWEDIKKNLTIIESKLKHINDDVDLIILPEMFLTGFSMNVAKNAVFIDGEEISKIKEWAATKNMAIMGSLAINRKNKIFNTAIFVEPNGKVTAYNKRHLFRMGGEEKYFVAGNQRVVIEYLGVRIMPLICYDLRFPIWSRNKNDYDLLVYVANWPASRQKVWDTLLCARAIENQTYVVGVNRIGKGEGIYYTGGSKVVDFKGDEVFCISGTIQNIKVIELNFEKQNIFRSKFPTYLDADRFEISP